MRPGVAHSEGLVAHIIELATRVHDSVGPGLMESVYRRCLCHELFHAGIEFRQQVCLPIHYEGAEIETGYQADIIVQNAVVLELKSVEQITDLHEAHLRTYLWLSSCRVGLLINFNTVSLADGIHRRVIDAPPTALPHWTTTSAKAQ
jgi:GxxExxY protein